MSLTAETTIEAPAVNAPGPVLFHVLYGSYAHGTATPESDHDWRGVYVLPDEEFLGLRRPTLTWEDKANDQVFWELGQFCRLLLKGNPNIVGMLWTPADCVYSESGIITALRGERQRFLHDATTTAYLGWVHREMGDIERQKRVPAKRLSHVPRLLWEIEGALTVGDIPVRLPPDKLSIVRAIKTGDMDYDEAIRFTGSLLLDVEQLAATHPLPTPPYDWTNDWLLAARKTA